MNQQSAEFIPSKGILQSNIPDEPVGGPKLQALYAICRRSYHLTPPQVLPHGGLILFSYGPMTRALGDLDFCSGVAIWIPCHRDSSSLQTELLDP